MAETSGKNKRRQIAVLDETHQAWLSVDSTEEADTLAWLDEAKQLSAISDFSYQPPAFKLSDKAEYVDVDGKKRVLFREHVYTADWVVAFDPAKQKELAKELRVPEEKLSCGECSAWIDCKGQFNSTERAFSYNQKWTWQKFGIYVYKLVPKKFFAKFGCPEKCRLTQKTKKPRKMFLGFEQIRDALK